MVYEVRWANKAILDCNTVINYLLIAWGKNKAIQFIEVIEQKVKQISLNPYVGKTENDDVKSILITKHNRMYYRLRSGNRVEIARIFDTRQDPAKKQFK